MDLVILATTQSVDAVELRAAVHAEARRRRLDAFSSFVLPDSWGPGYERVARQTPACFSHLRIADARSLMHSFIDTVLADADGVGTWDPVGLVWRS